MQKKTIIILILVFVSVGILFAGFLFLFPKSQPAQIVTNTTGVNFYPFKTTPKVTNLTQPIDISGTGVETPTPTVNENNSILKKISSFPVSGFGTYSKQIFAVVQPAVTPPVDTTVTVPVVKNSKKTAVVAPVAPATEYVSTVRYVNKATGNIYESDADKINEHKFTNTIIPKIYEAFFTKSPNAVTVRYLKDDNTTIESYLGTLPVDLLGADSAGQQTLNGNFLPEGITDMSVSSDGSQLFYLFNVNDNSIGIMTDGTGNKKSQIFTSPFTEWLSQWPSPKMVTLTTKPADGIPGYMYAINTDKKDLTKVIGGINGLTTLTSPSGKLILYSTSTNGNLATNIFNKDTGTTNTLGAKTLPEKCVWTKDSSYIYCAVPKSLDPVLYPDSWYQGLTSFSDEVWKIDSFSGSATKIADPVALSGEGVDGIKLALDDNEDYLFFINKQDNYLWELKVK